MRRAPLPWTACVALLPGLAAAQLPSGPEFRVNTQTTGEQVGADVAIDPVTGEFLITWAYVPNCYAQRFTAQGVPIGLAFGISAGCSGGGTAAYLPPGGFLTLAINNNTTNSTGTVYGVRFGAGGVNLSGQTAATNTAGVKGSVGVASDGNGNFVAVWASTNQDGSGYGVFARRFLYSGEPVLFASESRVNTLTAGDQRGPAIARQPTGEFVIVWQDASPGPVQRIAGRRFDANGIALGPEFRVDDLGTPGYFPDVAADSAGNFVVVWHNYFYSAGYNYNVYGRRFAANGSPLGASFHVNTNTLGQSSSAKVARSDMGFVVVWQELQGDGSGAAVMARRYSANGSPVASVFHVNTYTQGNQEGPAVAARPGGPFVVAWSTAKGGGSLRDVYAQRFCIGGDVNGDGNVNVADVLYLINNLFAGGPPPAGCADADGNASVAVSDVLYLINFLFASGPAPH